MGKRGQRKGDADADELAAEAAELSVDEAAAGPWEAAWDATMEGSAAARAKGAAAMCALLQKGYERRAAEEQEERLAGYAESVLTSKRSDKAVEAVVAHTLAALFVTLGRDCAATFALLAEPLEERCREGRSRAACISAYGAGAFAAAGGDDGRRVAALRALAGLWLTQTGRDLEAALRAWALVASGADARALPAPLVEAFVETLDSLLAGSDVAVRNAAVTATGVLYHRCGLRIVSDLPPAGPRDSARDGSPDGMSEVSVDSVEALEAAAAVRLDASGCAVGPETRDVLTRGLESILRRVRELATNRGDAQRRSKGDRRSSKAAAAAVLAALSEEGRGERVKVPGRGAVTLTALPQVAAYRQLAAVLGSGVQAHLARNPLLAETFAIAQDAEEVGEGRAWRRDAAERSPQQEARARHKASAARMASHMMDAQ